MTNDGRIFFTHRRSARPRRTRTTAQDVYEYVDGRPQLITPGTARPGDARRRHSRSRARPGLDRRQRQRHRRLLLDLRHPRPPGPQRPLPQVLRRARRAAASPLPPRRPPCDAADECHGAGSSPPRLRPIDSRVSLGRGGNARPRRSKASQKHAQGSHHRRHSGSGTRQSTQRRREAERVDSDSRQLLAIASCAGAVDRVAAGDRAASPRRRAANTPITSYSAVPSTTQAGGHPDLEIQFEVKNRSRTSTARSRLQLRGRQRRDRRIFPPASSATRTRRRSARSPSSPPNSCPIDSQVGIVNVSHCRDVRLPLRLRPLQPCPAARRSPACSASRSSSSTPLSSRCSAPGPAATTASTRRRPRSTTASYPLQTFQAGSLGGAGRSEPRPAAAQSEASRSEDEHRATSAALCDANGAHSTIDPNTIVETVRDQLHRTRPEPSNSPLTPFLQNPTTCDAPLTSSLDVLSYDGGTSHAEDPWPQMTGCDQLSFNPSLYAQPTTTDDRHAPRASTSTSRVPQELSPTIPSPTELRATTVTLPPGFSINPNAADGKTACTDAEASFGTEEEAQCPEFSKVGSLDDRQLGAPGPAARLRLPRRAAARQPLPDLPRRQRLRHPRQARRHGHARPGDGPARRSPSRTCRRARSPPSTCTSSAPNAACSRPRPSAAPTRSPPPSLPGTRALGTQTSTQFFTLDSGPTARPAPVRSRPFNPSFEAGVGRQHRRRSHPLLARTHPHRRRPEPQRAERHHSARLLGDACGRPLLLRRRPGRRGAARATRAWPSRHNPSCPAGLPDRHRRGRRRRRDPPRLSARQGLPRRPLQRRAAQPRGDHPGGLGPL